MRLRYERFLQTKNNKDMKLENLTMDYLKAEFATANTNGTFKLWAKTFIMRKYNIDALAANSVFDQI